MDVVRPVLEELRDYPSDKERQAVVLRLSLILAVELHIGISEKTFMQDVAV